MAGGRRRARRPVALRPPVARGLTTDEISIILRAADELISVGGRGLLAKILKGSQGRRILEHGLDTCPVYGAFRDRTLDEIMALIDQGIREGYLAIVYSGRLPVLVFTERGWEIARRIRIQELFDEWTRWLEAWVSPASMAYLKDRNRTMIWEFLDKIERDGDERFIPLLERWAAVDYKKVRARIAEVVKHLQPQ